MPIIRKKIMTYLQKNKHLPSKRQVLISLFRKLAFSSWKQQRIELLRQKMHLPGWKEVVKRILSLGVCLRPEVDNVIPWQFGRKQAFVDVIPSMKANACPVQGKRIWTFRRNKHFQYETIPSSERNRLLE